MCGLSVWWKKGFDGLAIRCRRKYQSCKGATVSSEGRYGGKVKTSGWVNYAGLCLTIDMLEYLSSSALD